MSIFDTLNDAKKMLEDTKRRYQFYTNNQKRDAQVALASELVRCRGKLEVCKKDFERTIRKQSKNIGEGKKAGIDTLVQEQILWDAAIGYLLVRDAIFAMKTISNHDSISHAYDMLEAATVAMSGKRGALPKLPRVRLGKHNERNSYGYITSNAAIRQKEEILDSFFETLKENGDIEWCLEHRDVVGTESARLRSSYTGEESTAVPQDDLEQRYARANLDQEAEEDADEGALGSYRPPEA